MEVAGRYPKAFFLGLGALFFSPLLLGYAFLPISYLALTPLWYDPSVVPGNYDLFDAIIYYAPLDEFFRQQLHQGVFPLWNPLNLGGIPMAFNGQSGLFYPVKMVLVGLLPVWLAGGVSLWLHLSVAGMAAFALARRMGLSSQAGLFMGIAWAWNGFLSGWLELGFIANSAMWTPLLVLGALAALESWKAVPLMAVALAMLVVSAHLQFVIYFGLFGLVVGLRLAGPWSVLRAARFFSGVALGLGLAAPYLIPSATLMSASQRPSMTTDFLLSTYRQFLASAPATAILPDIYGNPADLFAWTRISGAGNFIYSETVMYLGIIPLLFALGAATDRQGRFYLLAGLTALLVPATPIYLLLAKVPAVGHLSSVRWVGLVHLFLVVAAGHGFDAWLRGRSVRKAHLGVLLLGAWAVLATLRILDGGWQAAAVSKGLRLPETGFYLDHDSYMAAVKRGFEACYSLSNLNFLLPLALLLAMGWMLAQPRRFAPYLLLLTALDLASFSYRFNPVEPHSGFFARNATVDFLERNAGGSRVAGLGTVKPNTLQPFAVADIGGYDSFYPVDSATYFKTLLGMPPAADLPGQVLVGERVPPALLDHLGVRYLIGRPGGWVPPLPVVSREGLPIYEFPSKIPRAGLYAKAQVVKSSDERMRTLLDSRFARGEVVLLEQQVLLDAGATGQASVVAEDANQVTVQCQSQGRMLLVLNDAWCDGWRATVNGQPRAVLKANQMFRAVPVEAGSSTVVFRFHPPGWSLALPLCGLSLLLCLGLAFRRELI